MTKAASVKEENLMAFQDRQRILSGQSQPNWVLPFMIFACRFLADRIFFELGPRYIDFTTAVSIS